jgi:DNA invertase Pin-like site-specific DNA recombinase
MAKPINTERNKNVVRLRDNGKKSWRQIANIMNLAHSTVHEIYYNEMKRSGLTVKSKTVRV